MALLIGYLWRHRERPRDLQRLLRVTAKRAIHAPDLLRQYLRMRRLLLRGASIGDLVVIGESSITGDMRQLSIGRETALGRCDIKLHDRIEIGERVVINDGVQLITASHSLSDPGWSTKAKPIRICDYAWIAQGAIILPGVNVGRGAVVGAGAVVRSDVPDFAVAIGNPAVATPDRRSHTLDYSPARCVASIEAWLGPVAAAPATDRFALGVTAKEASR